jgi:hypothetical protein
MTAGLTERVVQDCRQGVLHALTALGAGIDQYGVARAGPAADFSCAQPFTGVGLREMVRREFGADIGFEVGQEAFSAMLALLLLPPAPTTTHDRQLEEVLARTVGACRWRARFRFFIDTSEFPADTDCSAVAATALYERGLLSSQELLLAAREVSKAAAPEGGGVDLDPGVVMVYWQDDAEPHVRQHGPRHDVVACANAVYLLKLAQQNGGGTEIGAVAEATLDHVARHLTSGRYLLGTRYYPSPDAFLFAAARLCRRFADCDQILAAGLRQALLDRETDPCREADDPMHALNLAQRIIAADNLGQANFQVQRVRTLLDQQMVSGLFPSRAYYRMGRFPAYFGSSTITTLFAVNALYLFTRSSPTSEASGRQGHEAPRRLLGRTTPQ